MIPFLAAILISGQSELIPKADPLKACPPGYKDAGPSFCEKMEQRVPVFRCGLSRLASSSTF
jgi:hypothetical protein